MINKITIQQNKQTYFDDVVSFLCSFVSLTLTAELYITGKVQPYAPWHGVVLDSKQTQKQLRFFPHNVLSSIFSLQWPSSVEFSEESVSIHSNATLSLGALEIPLTSYASSMFISYFERHKPHIVSVYKERKNWPTVWNFGWVVRNALAHGGAITFLDPKAAPVSWEGLTYSPSNNTRLIMNTDIWPGDIIYLMMNMDSHVGGTKKI